MNLALFDLDHTLIPMDSDHAWGRFTVSLGWRDAETFGAANERYYRQYQSGTLDIHDYIRFATAALREQGMAAAHQARQRYMDEVVRPHIRPAALELLAQHRAQGDALVIVTATNAFVTRPIADALGVDELIAIDLDTDAQGLPTGSIRGTPSFREGKVARVEQWLAARGLSWADVGRSTFYSDSINDLPLLERVTHPVATNADERLLAIAQQRGWRLLNLFS